MTKKAHRKKPNEVEKIPIPFNENNDIFLEEIDSLFRKKHSIEDILNIMDKKILSEKWKLSDKEIKIAQNIWKKLSSRRIKRGKNHG